MNYKYFVALFLSLCAFCYPAYAQPETEPNNGFPTANLINENSVVTGSMSAADQNDYFKSLTGDDGTIRVYVTYTNQSGSSASDFVFQVLTSSLSNIVTKSYSNVPLIGAISDSFDITCRLQDTIYLRSNSSQSFDYSFSYKVISSGMSDSPSNDLFANAEMVTYGVSTMGRIGYFKPGYNDAYDHFKTYSPDDGTVQVVVSYTNTSGASSSDLYAYVLNSNGSNLGSKTFSNVPLGATFTDTIEVFCRAKDSIWFKTNSTGCFAYGFTFLLDGVAPNDLEPNNTLSTATWTNFGSTVNGRVGYVGNGTNDVNDYFKTFTPDDGRVKMVVSYTNTSSYTSSDFYAYVLNYNGSALESKTYSNVPLGATFTDTLVVNCRAQDSIWMRATSTGCFTYSFQVLLESAGPNDSEPNNTVGDAQWFPFGTTPTGRIGYVSNSGVDANDYFKTYIPDDGSLSLVVTYTNTSQYASSDFYYYLYNSLGSNLVSQTGTNVPVGATLTDTIQAFCLAQDTMVVRISHTGCFDYSFQLIHHPTGGNDSPTNDAFNTAQKINFNASTSGRIGYSRPGKVDANDYFKTLLPDDGTVSLVVNYTNTSNASSSDFYYYILNFNGSTIASDVAVNVPVGSSGSDTISAFCLASDTIGIRISHTGCFAYNFEFIAVPGATNDIEPNNSYATANKVDFTDTINGRMGHTGSQGTDVNDYYKMQFPGNGTWVAIIDYQNTSNAGSADLYTYLLDKNGSTRASDVYANIPVGQWYTDTLTAFCVAADTVGFRVAYSGGCFNYTVRFEFVPSAVQDIEPNGSLAMANTMDVTQTHTGTVGHYNSSTDSDDYFKFYNSGYKTIRLKLKLNNTSNSTGADLWVYLLNKNGSTVSSTVLSNLPLGASEDSSLVLSCYPLDTFYVRLHANNCFGYEFSFDLESGIYYKDFDNDLYGSNDSSTYSCSGPPAGYIALSGDCNDFVAAINPGATEICNGVDDNCNGLIDEGLYTSITKRDSICLGDSIYLAGAYQTTPGTYIDTIGVLNQCDSICITILKVLSPSAGLQSEAINMGDSIYLAGAWQTVPGNYIDTLVGSNGCDSILTTVLTYTIVTCTDYYDTTYVKTCDSLSVGISTIVYPKSDGCDSSITYIVTLAPSYKFVLPKMSVCQGDSVQIFGIWQSQSGMYFDSLTTTDGCDSVYCKELEVCPTYVGNAMLSICDGDSAMIGGTWYSMAGIYPDSLKTKKNCDSIIMVQLKVDSLISTASMQMICDGDSVLIFGTWQSANGTWSSTGTSQAGCDSTHSITLTVKPNSSGASAQMICDGDSAYIAGAWRKTAGSWMMSYPAANGCDSVHTYVLNVKPNATGSSSDSICPGDSIYLAGAWQTTAGTYISHYMAANGCDSAHSVILVIRTDSGCTVAPPLGGPLSCVSDGSWMLSTVVTTATANKYPWPGVSSVPDDSTFTLPVVVGQPYPWTHLYTVPGSEVISSLSGVTYYRKTFELIDPIGIEARFRMFVDDNMQIFINGTAIALEEDMGKPNWRTVNHDLLFNGDGTYSNPNAGGDPFDAVPTGNLDTVFRVGTNSVVLAIRNRTSKPDKGGFSWRMDLDKGAALVPKETGASKPLAQGILTVYPNPTAGQLEVQIIDEAFEGVSTMTLFDLAGKVLTEKSILKNTSLDLSDYAQGVYFIKVENGNRSYTQKVVKN